jgi:putative Holliday junction resolvase
MRILGLDFGTKRIGAAISDELLLTAQSIETIERQDQKTDFEVISKLIAEKNITEVVVGVPFNMNGTHSAKTKEAMAFIDNLAKAVAVPVRTQDERLTTAQAERVLLEADMSRAKRKGLRDKLAAQIILQSYLDSREKQGTDAPGETLK